MTQPRPFNFDTVFDDAGFVIAVAPPRPKRSFTPEEVEAIREEAFRQGESAAVAAAQQAQARTLADIAAAIRPALGSLGETAQAHRAAAADLALACGRAIAEAALDQFPDAPLQAALQALFSEIETVPRLVIRTSAADAHAVAGLEGLAREVGYPGQIVVRTEPGLASAAFVFEWGDGRAAYDPAAAAARVAAAIVEALAADGSSNGPALVVGAS